MPITSDQLRSAFRELNGKRDVRIEFTGSSTCVVQKALLVPVEDDNIVKLTDGTREYLIDVDRLAWVQIG